MASLLHRILYKKVPAETTRVYKSPGDIFEAAATCHQRRWGHELDHQPAEVILTDQNAGRLSNWDAWNHAREIVNYAPSGWKVVDRRSYKER